MGEGRDVPEIDEFFISKTNASQMAKVWGFINIQGIKISVKFANCQLS